MIYDLCIIGGGINGAGIARDAAGRGLKVLLLEKGDVACATSSSSSKMIHGGLRYLEYGEFGLVRKSLAEREVMLNIAPQIVRPIRICIPQNNATRPAWMVRIGLFIYDHLWGGRTLPASNHINLQNHPYGIPLKNPAVSGFNFSDCFVDDSRLVILNLMDAAARGAHIHTRTECIGVNANDGIWTINTANSEFKSRVVVNATGPYAQSFLKNMNLTTPDMPRLRLVQGSHFIVPKIYDGEQSYLLQQSDGRVVFVWPYEDKYTMIGTTETPFYGDPINAKITDDEKNYLLNAVNAFFKNQIKIDDIIWSFSGVRPLFDDNNTEAKAVTRDYRLHIDKTRGATLLSVFGGKLTTYRPLAEDVMDKLKSDFPKMLGHWTYKTALPIISVPIRLKPQEIDDDIIIYFVNKEFATTADDILWRRTKWGLQMNDTERLEFNNRFNTIFRGK